MLSVPWHVPSWNQLPTSPGAGGGGGGLQQAFSTLHSVGEDNSSLAKQPGGPWSFPVAGHRDLTLDLNPLSGKQRANTALFLLHWGGEAAVNPCCRV